jgi:hypothetical protein
VAGVKKKRMFVIVILEHQKFYILHETEFFPFFPKLNVQMFVQIFFYNFFDILKCVFRTIDSCTPRSQIAFLAEVHQLFYNFYRDCSFNLNLNHRENYEEEGVKRNGG